MDGGAKARGRGGPNGQPNVSFANRVWEAQFSTRAFWAALILKGFLQGGGGLQDARKAHSEVSEGPTPATRTPSRFTRFLSFQLSLLAWLSCPENRRIGSAENDAESAKA